MKFEVNTKNMIKSLIMVFLFGTGLISLFFIKNHVLIGYIQGFLSAIWIWPILGVTKWTWDPPIKRIRNDLEKKV